MAIKRMRRAAPHAQIDYINSLFVTPTFINFAFPIAIKANQPIPLSTLLTFFFVLLLANTLFHTSLPNCKKEPVFQRKATVLIFEIFLVTIFLILFFLDLLSSTIITKKHERVQPGSNALLILEKLSLYSLNVYTLALILQSLKILLGYLFF